MLRIALFLLTNLAVVLVASVVLNLLGLGNYLERSGGINLSALLTYCAVFGFSGAFISLLLSKWMAKRTTGTEVITQPANADQRWLLATVNELAERAGIAMPEVGVFPAEEANAFATGWNKNAALVAVSAGLLNRFSRDEIRAVLAHEIGHVANGDMVTLALLQGVVNTFVIFFARIFGHIVDRALSRNTDSNRTGVGFYIATFFAEMVLGVLASLIVAWFSRRREFRADYAGATLADKHSMISALQHLRQEAAHIGASTMPATLTAFGISSGARATVLQAFASHPPLEERIRVLGQL